MTKFDLDTLRQLCRSMFHHWWKDSRTADLWESRPVPYPLGMESKTQTEMHDLKLTT